MLLSMYLLFRVQSILAMLFCTLCFRKKFHRKKPKKKNNNIVYTDESMVQLAPSKCKLYHKRGQPRKFRPKAKHPTKVYIWAGISKSGAKNCVIFTGIMDGERYTKILEAGLLPFVRSKFLIKR